MSTSLLLIPLFTGFVFSLAGFVMLKFPPKNINGFYGYRTPSSMKSQERWVFAQVYASKEMIRTGVVLMLSALIGFAFDTDVKKNTLLGLFLMLCATGVLIVRVERAIKAKFGQD